jgi:hypothetical protein
MTTQATPKIAYTTKAMEEEITELTRNLDSETILLAAIAYGEASTLNDSEEIGGIAFAVANRARAYKNKTISQLLEKDPNYTYAAQGDNARYNEIIKIQDPNRYKLLENTGMRLAVQWAKKALKNEGPDPSNGAFWWDGLDIKTNYRKHPKVKETFRFGDPKHNIYDIQETSCKMTLYHNIKKKGAKETLCSTYKGAFDHVWLSTAAQGKTIFWHYSPEFLKVTKQRSYI